VRREYSSLGRSGSTSLRRRDIIFWAYDYLDDLPLLVSTRKLVKDGSHDINN
jgi:hypothetical protein